MDRSRPAGARRVRGGERKLPTNPRGRDSGGGPPILHSRKKVVVGKKVVTEKKKLYVIDTNVLMHDPLSFLRFKEHDPFIPAIVREELDRHKNGHEEINRNARQFFREIKRILSLTGEYNPVKGIPLSNVSNGVASGCLYMEKADLGKSTRIKADNEILFVTKELARLNPEIEVILVTKDGNLQIDANLAGIKVEDYRSDMVIEDTTLLYSGACDLPSDFLKKHEVEEIKTGSRFKLTRVSGPLVKTLLLNQFVTWEEDGPCEAVVVEKKGNTAIFKSLLDYREKGISVSKIHAKNTEQNYALNLLLNPNIDFISLVGEAGSGKTLLPLAAGIHLLTKGIFSEIIMTRVTIPAGEDIGFLPGTEEDKMGPWMGALHDNFEFLKAQDTPTESRKKGTNTKEEFNHDAKWNKISESIRIKSPNYMRGRSFFKKFLIIDEAQNLIPKQAKMLISRAGPDTKVVLIGDLTQIDAAYLTSGSSGLAYVVDRLKGEERCGHLILPKGERSYLANLANRKL